MDMHFLYKLAEFAAEGIGLLLLAREVWRGHEMEDITNDFTELMPLLLLYSRQDYEGFAILSRLKAGDSPDAAQEFVKLTGATALKTGIDAQWTTLSQQMASSYHRYSTRTSPKVQSARKLDLILGTGLLIAAALMHLF